MKWLSRCLVAGSWCTLFLAAPSQGADLPARLQQFSDFPNIDFKSLQAGNILSQRGRLMNFPTGISTQLVFTVPLPPAETAKQLQSRDSSTCKALNVHAYQRLRQPCEAKDFDKLRFDLRHHPVKWLQEKTLAATAGKPDLNLTRSEAQQLAACSRKGAGSSGASACWAGLLIERATAFQRSGVKGILSYESGNESVSPVAQIRSMLKEHDRITTEFAILLQRTGIFPGNANLPLLNPLYYWSMFDADHHATLNLGAFYLLDLADRYQLLDLEYYVSGNYYTSVTLYEIWPFREGTRTGSLVWRGDFIAAPILKFTKGMERIAYGAIMIQELKKDISCFRNSLPAAVAHETHR